MADKKGELASQQPAPAYNQAPPAYGATAYPTPQGYPPQGYPPVQGYPPQPAPAPVGISDQQRATNERRARETKESEACAGLLCGGCLICLCVGPEKAAECGVRVMDRLLCMDVHCWGL